MHNNELFTQFTQKAEFIRSQIDIISVSLLEEKIPDKSIVQDVITGIDNLRSLHQQIREYAGSFLPDDKIPSEDAPVSDYRIAIEQSLAFQIQKKFDEIGAIIQKFLSVYSEIPESNTELKIYQDQASVLFDDLQDTQQISEDAEKLINAYSAFLTLVPMKDSQSDEWYAIFDPLDDSKVFSRLLMRRLSRHDFMLSDDSEKEVNEKPEESQSVIGTSKINEAEFRKESDTNNTEVQSVESEEIFMSPRNPIKTKTASTGTFLKILQNEKSLFKIERILPLLYHLGPLSIDAIGKVWELLDSLSPLVRLLDQYSDSHPNEENKYFTKSDMKSEDSEGLKTAESVLMPILEYLEKSNVISFYDLEDDKNLAICLTPYAYECMGKEKIRNYRYPMPGPLNNQQFWEKNFRCKRKFTAKKEMSLSSLCKAISDNHCLLAYVNAVSRQLNHEDDIRKFMREIEWDGEYYHANVYKDENTFYCTMLVLDGRFDLENAVFHSTSPILFCASNLAEIDISKVDCSEPIFLLAFDLNTLFEWNGSEWIEIFTFSPNEETLLPENTKEESSFEESGLQNEQVEKAVLRMNENDIDDIDSDNTKIFTNESKEMTSVIKDDESISEMFEDSKSESELVNDNRQLDEISAIDLTEEVEEKLSENNDQRDLPVQSLPPEIIEYSCEDIESYEKQILLDLITESSVIPADPDYNSLTASQMGAYLYNNNINPSATNNVPLFSKLIYQLISEKKLSDAVLLARALASLEDQESYCDFCKLVEAACDIEGSTFSYTGSELQNLQTIFAKRGYTEEDYIMLLTAAIRGLFKPTNESGFTDYLLHDIAMNLISQDDSLDKKISSNIKGLMTCLSEMMVTIPNGFSDEVLDTFKKTGSKEKQLKVLASQAGNLMITPTNAIQLKDLSTFLREKFGPKSELYRMLSYVHEEKREKGEEVLFFLETYLEDYKDFSEENIKQYVQDQWRGHTGPGSKLQFGGLNNVIRAFGERFTLLEKWVHTVGLEKYSISGEKKTTASKTRSEVIVYIEKIIKDLHHFGEPNCKTYFALEHELSKINRILQTDDYNDEDLFLNENYLTYYLIPNDDGLPVTDAGFNTILFFEQWRNVLRHILSSKIIPTEVLTHIQEDGRKSYWGNNYGSARQLIEKYHLGNLSTIEKKEMDHAIFNVYYSEHFVKELEMAVFYGKITENVKDDLIDAESSFRHYFRDSENYGQYRYFLSCLLKIIDLESYRLTIEKKLEIENLPEEIKIDRKDDISKISNLINIGNFTAVDDKLKRMKDNEYDLWLIEEEKSYFDHFLSVYDDIYNNLKDNKGLEVVTFYESVLKKNKKWELELSKAYRKNQRSQKSIFPNWGKDESESAVKALFAELDFPVKNVKKDKDHFILSVQPSEKNLPEYPHPIAKFGTRMNEKIKAVYRKGVVTSNQLIALSKKYSVTGTGIIFLVDYAIPLQERRKIAEDFMSSDREYPFIVIDRVLLFYLAAQEQANRMQVLLECTLPFSYTQPYVDGKGDVPDEMFFGRHTELSKIRFGSPSCFVYGGRQLGKTALMRRTESLENKPDDKQFAVYLDAKENNVEKTVSQISGKLFKLKIIPNQPKTMSELCNSIERKLTEGRSVKKLLLLIDEADAYLEDDRLLDYSSTKKLWDLHRDFPQDFKFVFAGLHNVARTAYGSENNSLIGQFKMVPIGQLSKKDAQQLIQKPMGYLGFRLKDEQIASIIENANYYPGVLQYFCHEMLEEVYGNYRNHFSAQKGNPPFEIKEENLKRIISKANLSNEIKDRLSLTLKLDPRYMFFANLIAYLYYQDKENGYLNPHGYSIRTIKQYGKEFAPHLTDYDYEQILPEMDKMGILVTDNGQYKLRRASFLEMINDYDTVEEYLLSVEEKDE